MNELCVAAFVQFEKRSL